MRQLILILALAMLIGSAGAIKWSGIELREDANVTLNDGFVAGTGGIVFNGTAPTSTTGVLYSDSGTLMFDGSAVGGGNSTVTVGPYSWCTYITDGTADEVQINYALTNSSNVIVVGSNTIAAAITPGEGDTLTILGTIYKGAAAANIISSTAGNVTILGPGTVDGNRSTNTNTHSLISLTGDWNTVQNLEVRNGYRYGIKLQNSNNSSVIGCTVTNHFNSTSTDADGAGIAFTDGCNDVLISGNTISRCGWMGISVGGDTIQCKRVRIVNNNIKWVYSGFGIGVAGGSNLPSYDVIVAGNTIKNTVREGINMYMTYDSVITDNAISDVSADYGISCWKCISNTISGNSIWNTYKSGIALDSCNGCNVVGNNIRSAVLGGTGTGTYGIFCTAESGLSCSYNLIMGNSVYHFSSPRKMAYCLGEIQPAGSTTDYNHFIGNNCGGYLTGIISLVGAHSTNDHNWGDFA